MHDTAPTTLYLDNANIGLNLNVKKESGLQQDEFCKLHNGLWSQCMNNAPEHETLFP